MRLRAALALVFVASGCFDLQLPPPPGIGAPGAVTGRVVWQRPGRLTAEGARGASVFLLGSSVAVATNADGRFVLEGITGDEGTLLVRFDADGDGVAERQRAVSLRELGANRGRTVSTGDLMMSQPSVVTGRVLRGDVRDAQGHGGTAVFVPGLPLATLTGADAEFQLEGVVEGPVQLAAVHAGYLPWLSSQVVVRGGEELRLSPSSLVPTTAAAVAGVLRGRVTSVDGAGLPGVTVRAGAASTTSAADGAWRFEGLTVERYDVVFTAPGHLPAALFNVLVAGTEEIVTADVVLAVGEASATTTPSLITEVTSERDAGMPDAGMPDAGMPDAGSDAGVNPGVKIVQFSGTMAVREARSFKADPTGGATPISWSWSASPSNVVKITSETTSTPTVTADREGTATVTVRMDTPTGFFTDSVSVTVSAMDAGTFTVTTDVPNFSLDVGTRRTISAQVTPTPVMVSYAWSISNPSIASIVGSTTGSSVVVEGTTTGTFNLNLTVTADGQTQGTSVAGEVLTVAIDAGATPLPLATTDAGITPLTLWLETAEPVVSASGLSLTNATGSLRLNAARNRLYVVFDTPPPSATQVTVAVSTVTLPDGGQRSLPGRTFSVPSVTFSVVEPLVGGAAADLLAGVAFAPTGPVTTGRFIGTPPCDAGCFYAHSVGVGTEALLPDSTGAVVLGRRTTSAGSTLKSAFAPGTAYSRVNGSWSTSSPAPGPVFAEGAVYRAVGPVGDGGIALFSDGATNWNYLETVGAVPSGSLVFSDAVTRMMGGQPRRLVLGVSDTGTARAFEWQTSAVSWTEPLGLNTVTMATSGRLAMTDLGDVVAFNVVGSTPQFYGRMGTGNWSPLASVIVSGAKVVDLVSVGARVYALVLTPSATLELWSVGPSGGFQSYSLPTAACAITSAAMAASDFGELAFAFSQDCSGTHLLSRFDLK